MPELDKPKDRPTVFLEGIFGNKRTLQTLLSRSDEKELILDNASAEIASFDGVETRSLVRSLLNGLSRDDKQWDQDRRDCALEVLQVVDLEKIRRDRLTQDYIDIISSQNENSDPYGTISALLNAGTIVGPYLIPGAETRERVNSVWNNVVGKFEGDDRQYIDEEKRNVVRSIHLQAEELLGNPEVRLGWRERPDFNSNFDPGIKELHEAYLATTKSQKTFKIALWEHTPNFRTLCATYGIALERFWNIGNPDEVVESMALLGQAEMESVRPYFAKALQAEVGLAMEELTIERSRFLSDEVIHTARVAQQDILSGIGEFPDIVARFRKLIEVSKTKSGKAQRVLRGQIANFFKENGVVLEGGFDVFENALRDEVLLETAEQRFNERYSAKREMAAQLGNVFKLDTHASDYSLISRRREDLFLGDLTGDCTAYHLYTGINAWTVPIWLSNPGFNFFRINEGNHLIAKLGIVLAVSGEKPALVVDSFEVGQGIEDYDKAVDKIRGGLRFLKQWAERIRLADVFVNTVSNSSGAVDLLKSNIKVRPQESELHVLGDLQGVAELRAGLIGGKVTESIYLQSEDRNLELEHEEETEEQSEYIRQFEEVISSVIKIADAQNKGEIEKVARAQDWQELFKYIVRVSYPELGRELGDNWQDYERYMKRIGVNEFGQAHSLNYMKYGDNEEEGIFTTIVRERNSEKYADAWAREVERQATSEDKEIIVQDNKIYEEAIKFDQFSLLLKEMEVRGLTPEIALTQLYGQATVKADSREQRKLRLNSRLPVLTV